MASAVLHWTWVGLELQPFPFLCKGHRLHEWWMTEAYIRGWDLTLLGGVLLPLRFRGRNECSSWNVSSRNVFIILVFSASYGKHFSVEPFFVLCSKWLLIRTVRLISPVPSRSLKILWLLEVVAAASLLAFLRTLGGANPEIRISVRFLSWHLAIHPF